MKEKVTHMLNQIEDVDYSRCGVMSMADHPLNFTDNVFKVTCMKCKSLIKNDLKKVM